MANLDEKGSDQMLKESGVNLPAPSKAQPVAPDLPVIPDLPALGGEPAAIIGAFVAILTAVQAAAIPLPTWAHTVIAVALVVAGALGIRANVRPDVPVENP